MEFNIKLRWSAEVSVEAPSSEAAIMRALLEIPDKYGTRALLELESCEVVNET